MSTCTGASGALAPGGRRRNVLLTSGAKWTASVMACDALVASVKASMGVCGGGGGGTTGVSETAGDATGTAKRVDIIL